MTRGSVLAEAGRKAAGLNFGLISLSRDDYINSCNSSLHFLTETKVPHRSRGSKRGEEIETEENKEKKGLGVVHFPSTVVYFRFCLN